MGARGPKQKFTDEACPNKECGMYGQIGKGNVVGNGTYMTRNGRIRKFICHNCETTFTSRNNTAFFDFKTKDEKVLLALKMIVHKNSIRGVAEMLGVKPDTVCKWLRRAAEHSLEVNEVLMREMDISKVELDELWTIIQKKDSRRLLVARTRERGSG